MPPEIDYEKCIACGTCTEVCAEDVFFNPESEEKDKKPVVSYPDLCWHCNWCVKECPEGAIWLKIPMAMMIPYKQFLIGLKRGYLL